MKSLELYKRHKRMNAMTFLFEWIVFIIITFIILTNIIVSKGDFTLSNFIIDLGIDMITGDSAIALKRLVISFILGFILTMLLNIKNIVYDLKLLLGLYLISEVTIVDVEEANRLGSITQYNLKTTQNNLTIQTLGNQYHLGDKLRVWYINKKHSEPSILHYEKLDTYSNVEIEGI